MPRRTKLAIGLLVATVVLAAMIGTASAQRFETSNVSIRATYPRLTFSSEASGGGVEVICPITLEGSFHSRTIVKTSELLAGYITRAALNRSACSFTGGAESVEILQGTLPWHIRYESFVGALPNITRLNFRTIGVSLRIGAFGVSCLSKSTPAAPGRGSAERSVAGQILVLNTDETMAIPRFEGSFLCPGSCIFNGNAAVRVLGSSTTLIFVRLV